jgi:hypothetical protein
MWYSDKRERCATRAFTICNGLKIIESLLRNLLAICESIAIVLVLTHKKGWMKKGLRGRGSWVVLSKEGVDGQGLEGRGI